MTDTAAEIDQLSRRRQALWADPRHDPGEVARITKKLTDLYEERRHERARVGGRSRVDVIRQARVESELERLTTR